MQFVAAGAAFKDDDELKSMALAIRERVVPPAMLPMLTAMLQSGGMPGP